MTGPLDPAGLLAEIFACTAESDDPRLGYVTIQLDHRTWAELVHFRDDGQPIPTLVDWRLRDTIEVDDLFDADRHALVLDFQTEVRRMRSLGVTAFEVPRGRETIKVSDIMCFEVIRFPVPVDRDG